MDNKKLKRTISDISFMKKDKKYENTKKFETPEFKIRKNQKEIDYGFSKKIYTKVPKFKYHLLPNSTQIGYVIKNNFGEKKTYPIKSAFIKNHYINNDGQPGMTVISGKKTYNNLYVNLIDVYYYNRDHNKLKKDIGTNKKSNLMLFEELLKKAKMLKFEPIVFKPIKKNSKNKFQTAIHSS